MKILVRGDCTSRRMLMLNRGRFHTTFTLVTNEKAPNAVFVDHLKGISARPDVLEGLVDEQKMHASQRLYFRRQFERNVLDETGASLLVIDPYSEMNFSLWRHREERWRFWVPRHAITDVAAFNDLFESAGYATLEESLQDTATVVRHLLARNPGMPVLFLPQLLDRYPALASRADFNQLGDRLKGLIPSLHAGIAVPAELQQPEDLGTGGGPELTLHYSGETYWRCAAPALAAGLLEAVKALDLHILKGQATELALPAARKAVSLQRQSDRCVPACEPVVQSIKSSLQSFLVIQDPAFERTKELRHRAAVIDLDKYRDYAEYVGDRPEPDGVGFAVKPFHWRMHTPDIHDIQASLGPASPVKSVEELGGAPQRVYAVTKPACPRHWSLPWGVFAPAPGHRQGDQCTDERLVAFILVRRFGEFVYYSQVGAHQAFEAMQVLTMLHRRIVHWLLESGAEETMGLRALMHGGYDLGSDSLKGWRNDEAFEPFLLCVDD